MPTQGMTLHADPRSLRRSDAELRGMTYAIPLLAVSSVLLCLLPQYTAIPAWMVVLINVPLTIRIIGMNHELFHEPLSRVKPHFLLRLNLHVYTPLTVGFDEYRALHLRHHARYNHERDPDYWLIRGGKVNALWRLAFAPEYWFLYCVRHRILSDDFWLLFGGRQLVLAGYILLIGMESYLLVYLLATKIAFALSFLVFSFESHTNRVGEPHGVWNLTPRLTVLNRLILWVIGPYAYNIAYHHASHHAYPWISGARLPDVQGAAFPLENIFAERRVPF